MTAPTRVLDYIDRKAAEHETTAPRILSRDMSKETVEARHEAVRELAAAKKPNGKPPSVREVARWFNLSPGGVSWILGRGK